MWQTQMVQKEKPLAIKPQNLSLPPQMYHPNNCKKLNAATNMQSASCLSSISFSYKYKIFIQHIVDINVFIVSFKIFIIYFKLCVCMSTCVYVHALRLESLVLLELELQIIGNYPTWVLGSVLRSSERASNPATTSSFFIYTESHCITLAALELTK